MRVSAQRGATLVELVVSVAIFAVIAVASATLYSISLDLYIKDKLTQDVQREGDAVVTLMTTKVREGINYNVASTATDFSFGITGNQSRRFYANNGQLYYVDEAGASQTLLEPSTAISNLNMTASPTGGASLSTLRVTGTLTRSKGSRSSTFAISSTISTRPQQ